MQGGSGCRWAGYSDDDGGRLMHMADGGGGGPMNGHQIYQIVHPTGHFTGAVAQSGDGSRHLAQSHREAADRLTRLRMSMEQSWKGKDAEAAFNELQTYERVSAEAGSRNLEVASSSMNAESDTHSTVRNQLTPMPPQPEEASFWGFLPGVDSQEDKNAEWSEQNRRNIEVYNTYQAATTAHSTALSQPFPDFTTKDGDPGDDKKTTNIDDRRTSTPSTNQTGTTTPSGTTSPSGTRTSPTPHVQSTSQDSSGTRGQIGGPTVTPPPTTGLPNGGVRLPDGSVRLPDGSIRKPDGTIVKPDGTIIRPDGTIVKPDGTIIPPGRTGASGYTPGGIDPSRSGLGPGGSGGFGPGSASGAGGGAGGGIGGAVGGVGAGFGPGGSGSGAGATPLGAGKGAGVGGFGPGGAGAAAKGGGMGAGARGGMGGMMGGGGAGKGQGGEDTEHKDRYYQKQELEFQTFEVDEFGQKEIDPITGAPVVPPVIGG